MAAYSHGREPMEDQFRGQSRECADRKENQFSFIGIFYLARLRRLILMPHFCHRIRGFATITIHHGLTPMAICCHRFRDLKWDKICHRENVFILLANYN